MIDRYLLTAACICGMLFARSELRKKIESHSTWCDRAGKVGWNEKAVLSDFDKYSDMNWGKGVHEPILKASDE